MTVAGMEMVIFTGFVVGGSGNNTDNDNEGPQIKAWLNDEKFVNGGISKSKSGLDSKTV